VRDGAECILTRKRSAIPRRAPRHGNPRYNCFLWCCHKIYDCLAAIGGAIYRFILRPIGLCFYAIYENALVPIYNGCVYVLGAIAGSIAAVAETVYENVLVPIGNAVWAVASAVGSMIGAVVEAFGSVIGAVVDAISDAVHSIFR